MLNSEFCRICNAYRVRTCKVGRFDLREWRFFILLDGGQMFLCYGNSGLRFPVCKGSRVRRCWGVVMGSFRYFVVCGISGWGWVGVREVWICLDFG